VVVRNQNVREKHICTYAQNEYAHLCTYARMQVCLRVGLHACAYEEKNIIIYVYRDYMRECEYMRIVSAH